MPSVILRWVMGSGSLDVLNLDLCHVRHPIEKNGSQRMLGNHADARPVASRYRGDELAIVPDFENDRAGNGRMRNRAKFGFHGLPPVELCNSLLLRGAR